MDTVSALNVRVDPSVVERLDQIAAAESRSRSSAVRVLIGEALRRRVERAEHEQEVG